VRTSEAAVDRGFVEDERIFNVVAFVRENGDNKVLACRPVVRSDQFGCLGVGERFLHVMEQVATGIGPQFHVCRAKPERLLDHPGAHRDTRTCIVLRERDMRCTDTEDKRGIDLKMGVLGRDILGIHRDVEVFFFLCIHELDHPMLHEIREVESPFSRAF